MSHLTPLDVVNQSFKRGFRGYDTAEVDDFLDQVAESLQAYIQRNKELERELETLKEQMEEFRGLKDSLNEALILAQRSAEERIRSATQQSEAMLMEAKLKADKMISQAEADVAAMKREMARLAQVRCQYVAEFRAMLSKFDMMIREEAPVCQDLSDIPSEVAKGSDEAAEPLKPLGSPKSPKDDQGLAHAPQPLSEPQKDVPRDESVGFSVEEVPFEILGDLKAWEA